MTPESIHRTVPPPVSPSRRAPKLALALGAAALLAALALVVRGTGSSGPGSEPPPSGPPGPAAAAPARAAAGPAPEGAPEEAQPAPRHFAATLCWDGLERFNDTVTLETFREWAAPLLASRDPHVLEYLKARLAELIGDDVGRASEVLGWAREASPSEFKLLMAGIRGAPVLPKLAQQLTALGLDERIDAGRRAGFLDELQRMPRLEPAALEKLGRFAKDPAAGEAGWVAARAIGRVLKEDLARTGNAKPYLDQLISIGTESPDEEIRYVALEMNIHADAPLDAKATGKLAKVLASEGSPEVREVAAHELSLAENKAQALDIFAKAFVAEPELCVRWALFRFAARAAGKDALPVMAGMAMTDPRFQGDYHDFERLYASGIVDFDRIWLSLPTQDPHGCLHRDH